MRKTFTILATMLAALVMAAPVAAQERGDICEDPNTDPQQFVCGYLTVVLLPDAEATIDEVIERSGPEAELAPESPGGGYYVLHAPLGEEYRLVLQFREDPAVDESHLGYVGYLTGPATPSAPMLPDTAMPDSGDVARPHGLPGVAALAILVGAVVAGSFRLIGQRR